MIATVGICHFADLLLKLEDNPQTPVFLVSEREEIAAFAVRVKSCNDEQFEAMLKAGRARLAMMPVVSKDEWEDISFNPLLVSRSRLCCFVDVGKCSLPGKPHMYFFQFVDGEQL